jgi:hypothetical protein
VEFHLSHGDMIRLLRRCGLEVEDLIELRPEPGATASHPLATLASVLAAQWLPTMLSLRMTTASLFAMGIGALGLQQLADFALGALLRGIAPTQQIAHFATVPGMVHFVLLVAFAAMPILANWLSLPSVGPHSSNAGCREKAANCCADRLPLPNQKMPASVVDDQFRAGDFAGRELSRRQRVEPIVPGRDDERRRSDFSHPQFAQRRGAIDINTGETQRQRLDALDDAHDAIALGPRRRRDQFRSNAKETDQYRRRDLLSSPPREIPARIDSPECEPIASAWFDRNRTGR